MSQYKKSVSASAKTIQEADAMAKATAKPGQNKAHTKLIAQGIQKGIEEYKKREKSKARAFNKRQKKLKSQTPDSECTSAQQQPQPLSPKIPWLLLGLSWIGFTIYVITQ